MVPVVPCGGEVPQCVVVHATTAEAPAPDERTVRAPGPGVELGEHVDVGARVVFELASFGPAHVRLN